MKYLVIIFITILSFSAQAQNKTADTIVVDGVCGMCKDRIETALDVKGVWIAEWDVDTHKLYVVYKESKISKEQICTLLNEVGHDTELSDATDAQYMNVHGCCMYRDETVQLEHEKGKRHE